jgi:hypothetical protein
MCGALPPIPCMTWTGTYILLPHTRCSDLAWNKLSALIGLTYFQSGERIFFFHFITTWRMLSIQCMAGHVRNKCSEGCLSFQLPHMTIGCTFPDLQLQIWAGGQSALPLGYTQLCCAKLERLATSPVTSTSRSWLHFYVMPCAFLWKCLRCFVIKTRIVVVMQVLRFRLL